MNRLAGVAITVLLACSLLAQFPGGRGGQPAAPKGPWMDKSLSPDQRADLVIKEMTLDEKISLVHGTGGFGGGRGGAAPSDTVPASALRNLGGAGFIPGIPRLGIPDIQMADAVVGVTRGAGRSRYSTALPATLAEASSWDLKLAYEYGALIGRELRDQGFTMSLGGGVNITRELRNGRNFEYKGEDPILAGKLMGQEMKGLGAQGIINHTKHYALNDQETGRNIGNVVLDKRTMRETDLLAFEIGIKEGNIGAVMCSYNKVNGDWACENNYLLNDVLRKAWGFKGFVVSDWGATHSTAKAAMAGLDIEMPGSSFFGDALKKAVQSGEVPVARLDDMLHRILRTMIAAGQFDNPVTTKVVDVFAGLELAERVAEQGTVLLKNANGALPLSAAALKTIAVIGGHADAGVLSGGGSGQVDPPGGNVVPPPPAMAGRGMFGGAPVYFPSSPLKAIRAKAPRAKVEYNAGTDVAAAAALAKTSDVAIVFAVQPASEGRDLASLSLPDEQDKLIAAVAAANKRTIVILETGGAVTMPWLESTAAVLEAWYPGIRGAEAIASILFGDVNPSAKLPVSFARSEADLPQPKIPGPPPSAGAPGRGAARGPGGGLDAMGMGRGMVPFDIRYTEGLKVGYKWFDAENKQPLFAFGHGLSYTTYTYSGLKASASGGEVSVTFTVRNTGKRAGAEIAQVYASLPASTGEPPKRLVAWEKVQLAPGEAKTVNLSIPALHLAVFNEAKDGWEVVPGDYRILAGGSSRETPLSGTLKTGSQTVR